MFRMLFIILTLLLIVFDLSHAKCNLDVRKDIPENARKYLPTMYEEVYRLIGKDFKYPYYFGSLIEHESCISLCWKRCWNPKARLKTKREEGAGLAQLTRVWKKNGKLRFDIIKTLKRRYRKELNELSWNNVYNRPDLQIRAMLLLWKGNWYKFSKNINDYNRLAMSDASYNQGYYRTYRDRMLCKMTKNCNPNKWFGNVERTCTASHKPLYGRRSPCDISRHHVYDVLKVRLMKYKKDWLINDRYLFVKSD